MDTTRRAATASAHIGIVAAVATAVIGFVLADVYRPHPPRFVVAELSGPARRSNQWSVWHLVGSAVLVVAAVANLALTAAFIARARSVVSRKTLLISAAIVAAVMSVATVITRSLVEWDQLALWAVTVGSDIHGYWTAAFGGDVQFVLMGNIEVPQRDYAIALVIHLTAPVVSAVALCIVAAIGRTRKERTSDAAISTG